MKCNEVQSNSNNSNQAESRMILNIKQENESNGMKYIYIIKDVNGRVFTGKHEVKVDTIILLLITVTYQQTSIFC